MKTIGIFKSGCPSGWTLMSEWVGKFLQGASSPGGTGGSDTHYHSVNMAPELSFGTNSTVKHPGNQNYGSEYFSHYYHYHTMDPASSATSTDTSLPPYMGVVFCYKEE
jgi:hypothetical protein